MPGDRVSHGCKAEPQLRDTGWREPGGGHLRHCGCRLPWAWPAGLRERKGPGVPSGLESSLGHARGEAPAGGSDSMLGQRTRTILADMVLGQMEATAWLDSAGQ